MSKLLFLGHVSLHNLDSAPKVRTYNLYKTIKQGSFVENE